MVGPNAGEMAEAGEAGIGRMAEPLEIVAAASSRCSATPAATKPLAGKRVLVTSGPTHEPIDPVRYIANRSSGKQGHAIAAAAAAAGAEVTLVSGPVNLPDPPGVTTVKVETAQEMLAAVTKALPADVAVFAAAVADWRVDQPNANKIKKQQGGTPKLGLVENPDILATVAHRRQRPAAARDRLCGRDRARRRARQGEARAQGLRLDRRQRRLGGHRRDGRRPQHRPSRHRARGRILAAAIEGRGGAARSSPASPTALAGAKR